MTNVQQVNIEAITSVLQAESIDSLSMKQIYELFLKESSLSNYKPESIFQIDPRNGELIVYNSSRASRPNVISNGNAQQIPIIENCPICVGNTTGIMDVTKLSEGFTFINKNMFPIFFPYEEDPQNTLGSLSFGLHFLQWSSSIHHKDWHNMPLKDLVIVFSRLAAL